MRTCAWATVWLLVAGGCAACGGAATAEKETTEREMPVSVEAGEVLIEREDWDEARAVFEQLLDSTPRDARVHYYLGLISARSGDASGAERYYRAALERDDALVTARNNLGLILVSTGRTDEAADHLGIVVEGAPEDASARFNLGFALEASDDLEGARTQYEKAAALAPEDPSPWFGLGDIAARRGDMEGALARYRKGREIAPKDGELGVKEVQALFALERVDEALEAARAIVDAAWSTKEQLATLCALVSKGADDETARAFYESAIEHSPESAAIHFLLGNSLARAGRFDEALPHFETAIEVGPETPYAASARKAAAQCRKALAGK